MNKNVRKITRMTEYRLRIDAFTPATLPMKRLAEYMAEFARLLGEPERVHFVRVDESSAVLVSRVDTQASTKVAKRLLEVRSGVGDLEGIKAEKKIDAMLATDEAVGQLLDESGAEVIPFPGRNRPKPLRYGPFREDGVLEGILIRIGGKDDSVPVWLRDGRMIHKCMAKEELARRISLHYASRDFLRVWGTGRWMREEDGSWSMEQFDIREFEPLDAASLPDVIRRLHAVQGAGWGEDPVGDLQELRSGDRKALH
jgi:hypothetical protein